MKLSAKVPGKLVIFGEYAVLTGAPAIVTAVNRWIRIKIQPAGNDLGTLRIPHTNTLIRYYHDGATYKAELPLKPYSAAAPARQILSIMNRLTANGTIERQKHILYHLTVDSSDFFSPDGKIKMGLGSSAAVTVGLVTVFGKVMGSIRSDRQKWMQESYRQHNTFQNRTGSGIDIAASVFGGILCYCLEATSPRFVSSCRNIRLPNDLQMRFVWTGRPASTAVFLKSLSSYENRFPEDYRRTMQEISRLARDGCRAIETGNTAAFLRCVEDYYHRLENLGDRISRPIISADHRRIARIAYQNGGYYKPSGAGGGDFGILFGSDCELIDRIGSEVERAGYRLPTLNIEPDGATITVKEEHCA